MRGGGAQGQKGARACGEFCETHVEPRLPDVLRTTYIEVDADARVSPVPGGPDHLKLDVSASDSAARVQFLPVLRLVIRAVLSQLFLDPARGADGAFDLRASARLAAAAADGGELPANAGLGKAGLMLDALCGGERAGKDGNLCRKLESCLGAKDGTPAFAFAHLSGGEKLAKYRLAGENS